MNIAKRNDVSKPQAEGPDPIKSFVILKEKGNAMLSGVPKDQ